jgi:putative PIN family toxin of toxin-antitoxin system
MIVLDTNVLVSGLLAPTGAPAQLLRLITGSRERLAFDQRILAEYRVVLCQPRFRITGDEIDQVLEAIEQDGTSVAARPLKPALPDQDDLPFIEVAVSAGGVPLVTGNLRHYPRPVVNTLGIEIFSPAAWLSRIASRRS